MESQKGSPLMLKILFTTASVFLLTIVAWGQQMSPVASPMSPSAANNSAVTPVKPSEDNRYRIGAGDVIDIKVFNKPQFSRDGVKVDQRGMVRLPLIDEVQAACLTEDELATDLTTRLKEYIRSPEVTVQLKEYLSEPVAVLGAVRSPSRFQLQRRVRLLELLTFVNGPTESAGRTIQIVHTGSAVTCEPGNRQSGTSITTELDYYKLADTWRGDAAANPFVQPGDIISIATADQIYVIGNVVRPASIALTEQMTVSRAIAMAGGPALDTKKSEIKIIRQTPGTPDKKEIVVNLDAVNKHQAEDVVLVANDIVDVPASGGKRVLRSLMGSVIPAVGTLPIHVIP